MKTSDIAVIVLIASISVLIAFFVGRSLPFLQVNEQDATIRTVESVPEGLTSEPDPDVFNDKAINPTIKTVIGKDD